MQKDNLYSQGERLASELFGNELGDVFDLPLAEGDDLARELTTWVFGYLFEERKELTLREKVLCIISMCTVRSQYDMLDRWVIAAHKAGCARLEVQETIVTVLVYGGWPAARHALETLNRRWPLDAAAPTPLKAATRSARMKEQTK